MTKVTKVPPRGVYAPCLTFFNGDESIDFLSMRHHALRLAAAGITGLVIHGSNGEAPHLNTTERSQVIKEIKSALTEKGFAALPIIAGTGAASAIETVALCRLAAAAGADFALVLPPSYWPGAMTKPVLSAFFVNVADASPIPIMAYNFPMVASGIDLDSDLLIDLSKHLNIVGCKLTCGNLGKLHRIAKAVPGDKFAVLGGKSEFMLHALVGGSSGTIGALVNYTPAIHVELFRRYVNGDLAGAKELQDIISDADWEMTKTGVSGLKAAVSATWQYGSNSVRSPLKPVSFSTGEKFEKIVAVENKFRSDSLS
ncbi:MAG: hypothetical protein CYPHOPRED_000990 [Cyphobasidiales sp. Tagirdzhanova-0007]|nr:MAG: hypothetical protein CYPHOPRED_000990 [Cyphobasidiales sp. Tagirdzhanova-0007]